MMTLNNFARVFTALMTSVSLLGNASAAKSHNDAWVAWESGDIVTARERAQEHLDNRNGPDEARHLLFLTSFVSGDYEGALAHYAAIGKSYSRLGELDEPVLDAYLHLRRISDALDFARSQKSSPAWMIEALQRHKAKPIKTSLDTISVIPFADHPLTEYFPAFSIEINGQKTTAHVDTGGSFLHMGPERAKALGIETFPGPTERAHLDLRRIEMPIGIVDRLVLGDAVLLNVPVMVLPTLVEGSQGDFVIFGTRILEPFLSTLDYPRQQLILSPRRDNELRQRHLDKLPVSRVQMPFYLWGDHMMFTRGNLGTHEDLNFFVDSGLVAIYPDTDGSPRQVGFTTSKKNFKKWGIPRREMRKGFFRSPYTLGLGTLQQDGHFLMPGRSGDNNFGGVRIDGLISHGFLKQYAWTIDFDSRQYIFYLSDPSG